ncbi:MAG: response regulator [Deltaproteobacteria bacterium]
MVSGDLEQPKRILVVEDDPTIQHMLRRTFEASAEVQVAGDGLRGLELLAQWRPEFVITDLMLPEVDGLALIKRTRRTYYGACVPILVLTANTDEQVLLDCFRQGADDFMVKPFSLSELRVRVASIYLRTMVARDVNPLTRLPGNMVIKQQVNQRLLEGQGFAVASLDIDHFKAFNDTRGFDEGDEVIRLLARILEDYTLEHSGHDVWVGHIGGDDFVGLMDPQFVDTFSRWVLDRFAKDTRRFYSDEELEKGTVEIVTRSGATEVVPLLSLSIGVCSTSRPGLDDYRKITNVSAEVKKAAKATPGNSIFVDRRASPTDAGSR